MSSNTVWYFAYGSNLNEKVFCKRRGCKPLESRYAVLPGWRLRFNLPGAPFLEPVMANVEPLPEKDDSLMTDNHPREVHGVAYKITAADWDEVYKTEGDGRIGGYKPVEVHVTCRATNEKIRAVTLSVPQRYNDRERPASKRYMTLIIEGGEAAGFDEKYLTWLRNKQHFERALLKKESKFAFYLSFPFLGLLVLPVFIIFFLPMLLIGRFVYLVTFTYVKMSNSPED